VPKLPSLKQFLSLFTEGSFPTQYPVEPDDDMYRLTSQSRRDLMPVEQRKMIELAAWLTDRNPLARRLIEIQTEHVIGDGITIVAKDNNEKLDKVLKKHWNHSINNWPVKGKTRFEDLRRFGEAMWPVNETLGSGLVVLGAVDPSRIMNVIRDPIQVDEADVVVLSGLHPGDPMELWKVIRENPASGKLEGAMPGDVFVNAPAGSANFGLGYMGSCFYFAINKTATASRGRSDLFALIDYLDGADQYLWSQLERAKLQNAMVWDVSVTGSPEQVKEESERIRKSNPTKPGTVNVHSASIVWDSLHSDLGSGESEVLMKGIMRWILGGVGLPEAYFAKGDETNRATLKGQQDPVAKRMKTIQQDWYYVINQVLRYQVERSGAKGAADRIKDDEPLPWDVLGPEIDAQNQTTTSTVISSITTALQQAEMQEYVSKDTARRIFLELLAQIGQEVDSEEEKKKIEAQVKETQSGAYSNMPQDAFGKRAPAPADPSQDPNAGGGQPSWKFFEGEHTGVMVALVPDTRAALQLAIPGEIQPGELHITLAYLGEATALWGEDRWRLIDAVSRIVSTWNPIYGKVGGSGYFNDVNVFYASVDSEELSARRQELVSALTEQGFFIDHSHGFTPHITLAYGVADALPQRDVMSTQVEFRTAVVAIAGEQYFVPLAGLGQPAPLATESSVERLTEVSNGNNQYVKDNAKKAAEAAKNGQQPPSTAAGLPAEQVIDTDPELKAFEDAMSEPLKDDELTALIDYTEDGYEAINRTLRLGQEIDVTDQIDGEMKKNIDLLDKAIGRNMLPHDTIVWRGVDSETVYDIFKPGTTLEDAGFMSTSISKGVAGGFGDTLIQMRVPRGTPGLYVDATDTATGENELLLPRGLHMKVISIKQGSGSGSVAEAMLGKKHERTTIIVDVKDPLERGKPQGKPVKVTEAVDLPVYVVTSTEGGMVTLELVEDA
jgi:2'-5' RNA ligase